MESNNGSSESSSLQPDGYFDDSSEISDGLSDDASGIDSDGKVNVNTASSSELDTLPGIGPVKRWRKLFLIDHTKIYPSLNQNQACINPQ